MSEKILFNFATRSRPEKFFKCLENIYINSKSSNFEVLIKIDIDDTTMNKASVLDKICRYKGTRVVAGKSNNKIHAINRGLKLVDGWDILINTSDDMWFTEYGFDTIIRDDFREKFPEGDGFLHYNDGFQGENVSTMSIMDKKYYDRFGYIYHPSYVSLWCDNEAMEVAKKLGRHKYMGDKQLFQHKHPAWGFEEWDAQYAKTEDLGVNEQDKNNYLARKNNGFT